MQPQSTRVHCLCQHCGKPFSKKPSAITRGEGVYCSRECKSASWRAATRGRFWSKMDQSGGPDACWPWKAGRAREYGQCHIDGRQMVAHRAAWELTHGPIPLDDNGKPLWVLHNCPGGDNPRCCNPAHLWLGTCAENNRDRDAKGRTARGIGTRPETRARGERNSHAKLTAEQVRAIRALADAGAKRYLLAAAVGVTKESISNIVHRRTWDHLA